MRLMTSISHRHFLSTIIGCRRGSVSSRSFMQFHAAENVLRSICNKESVVIMQKETDLQSDGQEMVSKDPNVSNNAPNDKYLLVYFIILLHGIGVLMPWNMFITAKNYFEDYKLGYNYTHQNNTDLQTSFINVMGIVSQFPNLIFTWVNVFISLSGSLQTRILVSIVIELGLFLFTLILVFINTSSWPLGFFITTMATAFVLNAVNAIYQNSVYGVAAVLPQMYTGSILLGNNISGIFASVISLLTKLFSPNIQLAAAYYFSVALIFLLLCLGAYFILPATEFYQYYENKVHSKKEVSDMPKERPPYLEILKDCWLQCWNVFYVFFITLALFPGVHANIKRYHANFFISEDYFDTVLCFVTFNLFATLGNLLASFVVYPSPERLHIPVLIRTVFVPLFVFCNYRTAEGRNLTVFIYSEWIYWIIAISFALTHGYFSSISMMYCAKAGPPEHSSSSAMMGAAFLITGILVGLAIAFIFPLIIKISI